VVGMEQGPLRLVSMIKELLERKSSGSGLENQEYDHTDPSRWPHDTLFPQELALNSLTSGGHSVSIVCLHSEATEFVFVFWLFVWWKLHWSFLQSCGLTLWHKDGH
jgi:hypothetical protein